MTAFGMDPVTFWGTIAVYAAVVTVVVAVIMVAFVHLIFAVRRYIGARRRRARVRQIVADHEVRLDAIRAAWGQM